MVVRSKETKESWYYRIKIIHALRGMNDEGGTWKVSLQDLKRSLLSDLDLTLLISRRITTCM